MASAHSPGRIETLNAQQLYFELHGTGEPLLLLHGFSGSGQIGFLLSLNGEQNFISSYLTCAATAARAFSPSHSAITMPPQTCLRCSIS